jgi:Fe-S cluster assembly protein SufD
MTETVALMTNVPEALQEAFEEQLHHNGASPLTEIRRGAMEAFARQGIPTRKSEDWKYTPIAKFFRSDYAPVPAGAASTLSAPDADRFRLPGLDAHLVVVVNGSLRPDLSDSEVLPSVTISGLRAALSNEAALVEPHLGRVADVDADPFVALNTAFDLEGLFVHIEKHTELDRPLQVAFVSDVGHHSLLQPRALYVFGENSEALVVETYHTAGSTRTFTNAVTEVVVERAARANVLKLQMEAADAHRIDALHVLQHGASHFAAHTYTMGGHLTRNNVTVTPSGEGCESHLYGLYILAGDQHVDNNTLIDHAAPKCFSNELYRGIVDERSTGVFNGKVFVRRDSQQTNAYQSSQGVVLSEQAKHFSKPELEIYADDVKCSHGSTTGELEPEHIFYLRSRGLDAKTAKSLLLYAFARDIVEQLPHEAVRKYLDGLIEERLAISAAR